MSRVDKEVWGPIYWNFLHTAIGSQPNEMTFEQITNLEDLIKHTLQSIPCNECKQHSSQYLETYPLPSTSLNRTSWEDWMIQFHKHVSARLNKPLVYQSWNRDRVARQLLQVQEVSIPASIPLSKSISNSTPSTISIPSSSSVFSSSSSSNPVSSTSSGSSGSFGNDPKIIVKKSGYSFIGLANSTEKETIVRPTLLTSKGPVMIKSTQVSESFDGANPHAPRFKHMSLSQTVVPVPEKSRLKKENQPPVTMLVFPKKRGCGCNKA